MFFQFAKLMKKVFKMLTLRVSIFDFQSIGFDRRAFESTKNF